MPNKKMPALFIGHGSPMNIVYDNEFTRSLKKLGAEIPPPEAILVVSAHWLTEGTFVTCVKEPEQIYDFYGFPQELYDYRYPAKGSAETAQEVMKTLAKFHVQCGDWGLDHASWAVLKHLYPMADIPVLELSLCMGAGPEQHYEMGEALKPLREKGVLIIGSGNIVHNLGRIRWETDAEPFDWAVEFDNQVKGLILEREHRKLIDYYSLGENARLAVPTNDHYLPLLYTLALQGKDEKVTFIHEGIQNGSVAMRTLVIR
jgi:4,5-DOPA dioxygenase extradiol